MTRFARAKGSKSSNERLPEEATSWTEMKQQLHLKKKDVEDSKKRKEMETVRRGNYQKFLDETEEKKSNAWADFSSHGLVIDKNIAAKKKKVNVMADDISLGDNDMLAHFNSLVSKIDKKLDDVNESGFEESASEYDENDAVVNNKSFDKEDEQSDNENKAMKVKLINEPITKTGKNKGKMKIDDLNPAKKTKKNLKKNESEVIKEPKIAKTVGAKKTVNSEEDNMKLDLNPINNTKKKSKKLINDKTVINIVEISEIKKPANIEDKVVQTLDNAAKIEKNKAKNKIRNYRKKLKIKKRKESNYFNKQTNSQDSSQSAKLAESKEIEGSIVKPEIIKTSAQNNKTKNAEKKNSKKKNLKETAVGVSSKKSVEEMNEEELKKFNKKKERKLRQLEQRKLSKAAKLAAAANSAETDSSLTTKQFTPNINPPNNANNNKRQLPKPKDDKEHKKRKPNADMEKVFINGQEIELVYFDGFPIKKEDAERLQTLRKQMISKGLPRSEVKIAMKLERRKAEKALTREKKNVCFNCRKSGHNLSECPNIDNVNNTETAASGICFKCGSTEHTHYQCKVVKNQEFKFASCFICKEQGHIARQCPDNARGLYPKGGACKLCGDVTHLKKDCPKHLADQEAGDIALDVIGENIEGLENERKPVKTQKVVNKVVKF